MHSLFNYDILSLKEEEGSRDGGDANGRELEKSEEMEEGKGEGEGEGEGEEVHSSIPLEEVEWEGIIRYLSKMLSADGGRLSSHPDVRSRQQWPREYGREVDDLVLREALRTLTAIGGMMCAKEMRSTRMGDSLKSCGIDLIEVSRRVWDDLIADDLSEIVVMHAYSRYDHDRNPSEVMPIRNHFTYVCLEQFGLFLYTSEFLFQLDLIISE